MGSVFEIVFEPETVSARCLAHPHPRIVRLTRAGTLVSSFPRPTMTGENREVRRPNFGPLIGYRGTAIQGRRDESAERRRTPVASP